MNAGVDTQKISLKTVEGTDPTAISVAIRDGLANTLARRK